MQNELYQSGSLYLKQHANNPVHWQLWSADVLAQAVRDQRLLLLSIGYSSCHWCHVMEEESFEDEEVATLMNAHFTSIKIDREERPDLDARYMNAVQLMTGQGGWPLNCIALPDGTPVWGGTYFSKADWMAALTQIAQMWQESPQTIEEYAEQMREGLTDMVKVSKSGSPGIFEAADFEDVLVPWMRGWDERNGGLTHAPKFPMPSNYSYLLQHGILSQNDRTLSFVHNTLNKMALGGIYDFVHGGFTRYATDRFWKVPHFEKMLYDNAQLIGLYAKAYRNDHQDLYAQTISQTVSWLQREMKLDSGLYAAALDADSATSENPREEGGYYTWRIDELEDLALPHFEAFKWYFDISEHSAWEGKYILHRTQPIKALAERLDIDEAAANESLLHWQQVLAGASADRIESCPKPLRDPKALTCWNALLVVGLAEAHRALPKNGYDKMATALLDILLHTVCANGKIAHQYLHGAAEGDGFLDDYSSMGKALVEVFLLTGNEAYLEYAKQTATSIEKLFPLEGAFRLYTNAFDSNWQKQLEIEDNVIPSANSMWADFFHSVGLLADHTDWKTQAQQALSAIHTKVFRYGPNFSNWLEQGLTQAFGSKELVITGPGAKAAAEDLQRTYLQPGTLILWSEEPSDLSHFKGRISTTLTYYLCSNNACQLPTTELNQLLKLWQPS
ncbi:MAG: thioredoxin domain-containing protein [Cryomorphaceae bacterium]|nr:thioredoxin domain-containing protein [Cryomorphaceae bacterium]MBL6682175.1 thioredoxin domain-containing protein [Cryomorphaceae bacterium]MBL6867532.1 thioredoxin domain-containing protein [Cryomorphaceae bacterium]